MAFALALQSANELPGGHGKTIFTTTTAIVVLTVPARFPFSITLTSINGDTIDWNTIVYSYGRPSDGMSCLHIYSTSWVTSLCIWYFQIGNLLLMWLPYKISSIDQPKFSKPLGKYKAWKFKLLHAFCAFFFPGVARMGVLNH